MQPRRSAPWKVLVGAVALGVLLGGCSVATPSTAPATPTTPAPSLTATTATDGPSKGTPTTRPASPTSTVARPFDEAAAYALVERLAAIGPRDAASPSYRRAAGVVAQAFRDLGYDVSLQEVPVPAGVSWGVKVAAGSSINVVAQPRGFDPQRPHVVLGAHLDTVPQAPGAEDNASGVSVLVGLAKMLRDQPAGLPVRLVAFGGEEARGSGWRWYAFGSRHFVESLGRAERAAIRGMVSLDRVGAATPAVPVCHGGRGSTAVATGLRDAARVRTKSCVNRSSDHVSFERVGIASARIGSVPYGQYHSAADTPRVVDPMQLKRSAGVVWSWLRSL